MVYNSNLITLQLYVSVSKQVNNHLVNVDLRPSLYWDHQTRQTSVCTTTAQPSVGEGLPSVHRVDVLWLGPDGDTVPA